MPYVGFSGVANQANTSDGFALGVGARNDPAETTYGDNVGNGGVVDLYHNGSPVVNSFILMENGSIQLTEPTLKSSTHPQKKHLQLSHLVAKLMQKQLLLPRKQPFHPGAKPARQSV